MLLTSLPRSICQSVDLIERHHPSRRRKGSRAETSFYPLSMNFGSLPRLQPFSLPFSRPSVGNKIIYLKEVCSEITPLLFTGKLFLRSPKSKSRNGLKMRIRRIQFG